MMLGIFGSNILVVVFFILFILYIYVWLHDSRLASQITASFLLVILGIGKVLVRIVVGIGNFFFRLFNK